MEETEERVSGFEVRGSWADVVELGERVTEALSEAGVSGEAFEEWKEWQPKADERIDEETSEKTSEQASVDQGAGERADVSAGEASEELQDDGSDASDSIQDSVDYAKRAVDTTGRQALRSVEGAVYRNVMTRIAVSAVGPPTTPTHSSSSSKSRRNRSISRTGWSISSRYTASESSGTAPTGQLSL